MTNLLFTNAIVHTMDGSRPGASAAAVRDGRIVAVGDEREGEGALDGPNERIDCAGGALLPAFIDAHCHLLAYAAALRSVDCTGARSIGGLQEMIGARAAITPPGEWIRAFGYEETSLIEQRHPHCRDLDSAAPAHPLRLLHRGGHASVLNSLALQRAGITTSTEEPPGGRMERDLSTGEPSGVLLDMEERIDCATPRPSYSELADSVRDASQRMLRQGIACITDASNTNGREQWDLFERLIGDGAIAQDVVMMEGVDHLGELPDQSAGGRLRRGALKIMLHELGDQVTPDPDELTRLIRKVHNAGHQVAIHAVGERAVAASVAAIASAIEQRPRRDHRHRIEHCSILPEGLARQLASLGIVVVSQPGFLRERGERYLKLVPEEERSRLYAFRALTDADVTLAAGSDAPVTPPQPFASVASAVDRTTADGRPLAPEQRISTAEALRWWTASAARASFLDDERGAIRPGLRADIVLLERDPVDCSPDDLRSLPVKQLWIAGQPVLPD